MTGNSQNSEILPDPLDFNSPCVSLVSSHSSMQYSDISDDEVFEIPSSQKHQIAVDDNKRSVLSYYSVVIYVSL